MTIPVLYKDVTETKTGLIIPVCNSGRTIESKYDPVKEAEKLLQTVEKSDFYLLFGLGSGTFTTQLSTAFPEAKIICVENTKEDINLLKNKTDVRNLLKNDQIIITSIDELKDVLVQNYIPALYGNIKIIENQAWKNENKDVFPLIQEQFQKALKLISADFSVQSHFGKIWQKNILNNVKKLSNKEFVIKTSKQKAAIIAAGPGLDSQIKYLSENRNDLYIISTDTAYSTLIQSKIYPEIVVSIDGQFISHQHFMHNSKTFCNSLFAFDLCSNSSSYNNISSENYFFFNSGHPLSSIAAYINKSFPTLYSGAGTVTITAFDLAKFLGFNEFIVIGADFSYINGKPYAKGTYLDSIYNRESNKLEPSEKTYTKLMFRTETEYISENKITTSVLQNYCTSFEDYLTNNFLTFHKENNMYIINGNEKSKTVLNNSICKTISNKLDYQLFKNEVNLQFENKNYNFLLPYISYLRKQFPNKTFSDLLKLAYSNFSSYN